MIEWALSRMRPNRTHDNALIGLRMSKRSRRSREEESVMVGTETRLAKVGGGGMGGRMKMETMQCEWRGRDHRRRGERRERTGGLLGPLGGSHLRGLGGEQGMQAPGGLKGVDVRLSGWTERSLATIIVVRVVHDDDDNDCCHKLYYFHLKLFE